MNKVYFISLISGCTAFHVHAINLLCTILSGNDVPSAFPFMRIKKDLLLSAGYVNYPTGGIYITGYKHKIDLLQNEGDTTYVKVIR